MLTHAEPVTGGILADHGGGVDLRDELLGLLAQEPRPRQRPEVLAADGTDRTENLHLAGVVGRLGQRPRAELRIQVAQVGRRGQGRLFRVESLVDPLIDPGDHNLGRCPP